MKINLDRLIGAVQESFDNTSSYRLCFVNKKWYQMDEKERAHENWCERNEHGSNNEVSDLCAILGIDCSKLYTIARLARKWEEKRNFEKCFPIDAIADKIIDYLSSDNPSSYWDKNWLNIKINNKAKKAA